MSSFLRIIRVLSKSLFFAAIAVVLFFFDMPMLALSQCAIAVVLGFALAVRDNLCQRTALLMGVVHRDSPELQSFDLIFRSYFLIGLRLGYVLVILVLLWKASLPVAMVTGGLLVLIDELVIVSSIFLHAKSLEAQLPFPE